MESKAAKDYLLNTVTSMIEVYGEDDDVCFFAEDIENQFGTTDADKIKSKILKMLEDAEFRAALASTMSEKVADACDRAKEMYDESEDVSENDLSSDVSAIPSQKGYN